MIELDPADVAMFSATQMNLLLSDRHQFIQYYSQRRVCYPDYGSGICLVDKLNLYDGIQNVESIADFCFDGCPPIEMPIKIDVICDDVLYIERNIEDCPENLRQEVLNTIMIEAVNLLTMYNDSLRFKLSQKQGKTNFYMREASKIKVFTGSGLFSIRAKKTVAIRAFMKTKLKSIFDARAAMCWDLRYLAKTNRFYKKMIEYV